jgi:hypothetical protein
MYLTLENLRQIIREEVQGEELAPLLHQVISKLGDIDTSIDYLASALTGEDPIDIAIGHYGLGRHAKPTSTAQSLQRLAKGDE